MLPIKRYKNHEILPTYLVYRAFGNREPYPGTQMPDVNFIFQEDFEAIAFY